MKFMNSKFISIFILFSLILINKNFGKANEDDVFLTNQTEVNAFGANNFSSIIGSLTISGVDISDLSWLSSLTSIGGDLRISYNDILPNLDGLNGITSLGGNLIINNNSALINLDGLSSLNSINGYLLINNNSALSNLFGLINIASITEYFEISYNNALLNLDGLGGITSIGGDLRIASNTIISNLDGLTNLSSVGGDLIIQTNPELENFCGLYTLLISDGLAGLYNVSGNKAYLTVQQIKDNCGTISVNTKIFLEGPYSISNQNMNQNLIVPSNSPYSEDPQSVSQIPANVVDWVLLELRSVEDQSNVISSRSAFVLQNGSVVDLDGTSQVTFHIPDIRYYLAVKHRNHLAIISSIAIN